MYNAVRRIVCEEWNNAVSEFSLSPGSEIEKVISRIINRIDERGSRPLAFLSWAVEMFGSIARDRRERGVRLVEEALELAQALGVERDVIAKLTERVYSNHPGYIAREVGQVQATLEVLAANEGLSADNEGQREWERVRSISKAEWNRRHAAKVALGIAR